MTGDPQKPPFRNHPYYYPFIKVVVLACAICLALRLFGVL